MRTRPKSVADRRVLVTGGASGIGKAIASHLSRLGAHVIVVDKDNGELEKLRTLGDGLTLVSLDLNDLEHVKSFAAEAGRVDTVILNAAIYQEAEFQDIESDDIFRLMKNNFFGNAMLAQHLARKMNAGGRLIVIGSNSEHAPIGLRKCASYLASKAALSTFFLASCSELSRRSIMVNEVLCNGAFNTPMIRQVSTVRPGKVLADPERISNALLPFVIADPEKAFITGCSIIVQRGVRPYLSSSLPENRDRREVAPPSHPP